MWRNSCLRLPLCASVVCVSRWVEASLKVFVVVVRANFLTRSNSGHHCGKNSWRALSPLRSSFLLLFLFHTHTHTHPSTYRHTCHTAFNHLLETPLQQTASEGAWIQNWGNGFEEGFGVRKSNSVGGGVTLIEEIKSIHNPPPVHLFPLLSPASDLSSSCLLSLLLTPVVGSHMGCDWSSAAHAVIHSVGESHWLVHLYSVYKYPQGTAKWPLSCFQFQYTTVRLDWLDNKSWLLEAQGKLILKSSPLNVMGNKDLFLREKNSINSIIVSFSRWKSLLLSQVVKDC